jgi:hypothetical protein
MSEAALVLEANPEPIGKFGTSNLEVAAEQGANAD